MGVSKLVLETKRIKDTAFLMGVLVIRRDSGFITIGIYFSRIENYI